MLLSLANRWLKISRLPMLCSCLAPDAGKPAADVDATSIREFESQRAGQSAVPGYR